MEIQCFLLIALSFVAHCNANDRYPPCGGVALLSIFLGMFGLFTHGGGIALLICYCRTRKELLALTVDVEKKVDSSEMKTVSMEEETTTSQNI